MADCNLFEPLRSLSDEVLAEIVREGEARLAAQLQIASSADQRALTIAGLEITAATASLAGGIALAIGQNPDLWLALLALAFAMAMVAAAYEAVQSVRPQSFDVPGSEPRSWLPVNWQDGAAYGYSLKQARIEQATCLDGYIEDNTKVMEVAAKKVHRSLDICIFGVGIAATLLFATFIGRNHIVQNLGAEVARTHVSAPKLATLYSRSPSNSLIGLSTPKH